MRIVSWNIENLAPWLREARLTAQWRALGEPEVLCLQEIRIRPGDGALLADMQVAIPGFDCFFNLNRDTKNGAFRGGRAYGVATYIRKTEAARQGVLDWDLEGRLCLTVLPRRRIALANAYAVNGTSRPHWDHALGAVRGDRNAFKQTFIEQFGRDVAALGAAYDLVLIGDWNVSRAKIDVTPRLRTEEPHATARRRFNEEFIADLDLVDIFRERHPEARAYTWVNRRSRYRLDAARVDYALISRHLCTRVRDVGIEDDPALRVSSDHEPLWLELALARRPAGCA